jgi:epoxyqueuosine reductase
MNERIKEQAHDLGFDACHITNADPSPSAIRFKAWLESGLHGDMAYLARNAEKRTAPRLVLPGANSVITLASSYAAASDLQPKRVNAEEDSTRNAGMVARYARYADYHDVLSEPLQKLAAFINDLGGPGTRSLWYVDTGPLLERDLAQRSGLGFVGKHTNLISRNLGNWFFLSEILTTLELPPDAAEKNRCGSCARCLSACPTRAIIAPFRLDARRCISYLTIELKGSIPVELRPAIGNRIFGCDDCLEVCPWNRFAREGRQMSSHAQPDLDTPNLLDLLALDDAGFKRRFADTPILRTKRRGLLRNACVALGNIGDASALPALARACQEPDPIIAEHALWAISRIETRQAIGAEAAPSRAGITVGNAASHP